MINKNIRGLFALCALLGSSVVGAAPIYEHACKPVDVFATGNRVHVKCAHPEPNISYVGDPQKIVYFAVPASSPLANQLASIASVALANGKWLKITYDFKENTSFGCLAHDCRPLISVALVPNVLTPAPQPRHPPVD